MEGFGRGLRCFFSKLFVSVLTLHGPVRRNRPAGINLILRGIIDSALEKQKADEAKYRRQVLERVVNVIKFLA